MTRPYGVRLPLPPCEAETRSGWRCARYGRHPGPDGRRRCTWHEKIRRRGETDPAADAYSGQYGQAV